MLMSTIDPFIRGFEEHFNANVVAIKFSYDDINSNGTEPRSRFCEHVFRTMGDGKTRYLKEDSLQCIGTLWAFSYGDISEDELEFLANTLIKEGRFNNRADALNVIRASPRLERAAPKYVIVTKEDISADVYVAYMLPKDYMLMVQAYQRIIGSTFKEEVTGIVPICGSCAVLPTLESDLIFSMGCKESRIYGGLPDEMIAVGISSRIAPELIDIIRTYKTKEE